jgi:WD40 repeat protein
MKKHSLLVMVTVFITLFIPACVIEAPLLSPIPVTPSPAHPNGTAPQTSTGVPCFFTYNDPFAFTSDGTRLLVRGIGGVQVFNLERMSEEKFFNAPTSLNGPSVTLSPDGTVLVWALEGGTVQYLRLSNLEILATIRTRQDGPIKLEFSPSGEELYTASHAHGIMVWGMDGSQLGAFQGVGELVNIGLSPDGQLLATIPADGPVSLWNVDDFSLVQELGGSGGYDTSDAIFSPDGKYLAADLATGLYLWKLEDGRELLGAEEAINSMAVAFSPDGSTLAYADQDLLVLSSPDGAERDQNLEGHQSPIFSLLFSPDGSTLVSADDQEIRIWSVEAGELIAIGNQSCPEGAQ